MYVLTHATGIYVFDEKFNVVEKIPLELSVDEILKIKEGKVIEKEKKIYEELKKKYKDLIYLGVKREGLDLKFDEDPNKINKAMEAIRKSVKREEWNKVQELMISVTRKEIAKSVTSDLLIIQAINALDDLNRIINLMIERFREWYGLYAPEVEMLIEDHEKLVELAMSKTREEIMKELGIKETMGGELTEKEIEMLREYAKRIKELYELRRKLIEYIREMMEKVAPNVTAVAGPLVGARLISLAGSLRDLAMLPASTIQVLGAEKALFRHLRKGSPPPKHGVLFNHPYVQRLPKKLRGRMARTLAAKIAIAARVDAFSPGKYIGDKLKKMIDERFEQLKKEAK